MKSFAHIHVSHKSVFVRFSSRKFHPILKRWQETFPQAEWNWQRHSWELPIASLEKVKQFCNEYFYEVKIASPMNLPETRQLQFTLE